MAAAIKQNNRPLLIFIVIGAILFGIDHFIDKPKENTIQIDDKTINHILSVYLAGKSVDSVDKATINSLVKNYIESEMFYREALAMGLDKDDPIIKNRLIQKYQFLNQEEGPTTFTDSELIAYYKANIINFSQAGSIRFKHVFFSFDNRNDAYLDATKTFETVKNKMELLDTIRGDVFPFNINQSDYISEHDVARFFGKEFADSLFANPHTGLCGPIKSGLGYHIVYILKKLKNQPIAFENVKQLIIEDLRTDVIRKKELQHLQLLKEQYEVHFDLAKFKTTIEQQ
jgi:peptidyl-prolyl cis-trans isomerase C